MRRSKSLSAYKKRLWKIFSEYIRRKDADENGMVSCFTCGARQHWKEIQAGHYVHRHLGTYFDERNVKPQCAGCNMYRHGNLQNYAIELQNLYGNEILKELRLLSHREIKINRFGYEELIERYQGKLKDLGGRG